MAVASFVLYIYTHGQLESYHYSQYRRRLHGDTLQLQTAWLPELLKYHRMIRVDNHSSSLSVKLHSRVL